MRPTQLAARSVATLASQVVSPSRCNGTKEGAVMMKRWIGISLVVGLSLAAWSLRYRYEFTRGSTVVRISRLTGSTSIARGARARVLPVLEVSPPRDADHVLE